MSLERTASQSFMPSHDRSRSYTEPSLSTPNDIILQQPLSTRWRGLLADTGRAFFSGLLASDAKVTPAIQPTKTVSMYEISEPRHSPPPFGPRSLNGSSTNLKDKDSFAYPSLPRTNGFPSSSTSTSLSSASTEDPFRSASASSSAFSPPPASPLSTDAGRSPWLSFRNPAPHTRSPLAHSNGIMKKRTHKKEHIHARLHKAAVREEMQRRLFALKQAEGYSQDFRTFQEWHSYRERIAELERHDILSSSRGYGPYAGPRKPRSPSSQLSTPLTDRYDFDNLDTQRLQEALKTARDVLQRPRLPRPAMPNLDKLRSQHVARDAAIERRLRPVKRKLPTSLAPSEQSQVEAWLRKKEGLLCTVGKEEVYAHDLARLRPKQWLNDVIINAYGSMLMDRAQAWQTLSNKTTVVPQTNGVDKGKNKYRDTTERAPLNVHYLSTFFYIKLQDPGYEKARLGRWLKKVDIFQKDVVLVPINLGNYHWTCAAINFRLKRFEFYDSMGLKRELVYQLLRSFLQKEHQEKKQKPLDLSDWEDYFSEETPQQENQSDCGVFSCQFMEALSRGETVDEFAFTQKDMKYLRDRMVWEICTGKLIEDWR